MAIRNLALTSPFMEGADVTIVQGAVGKATGRKLAIDGEYGPATAAAVAYWKRYVAGYPERMLRGHLANSIGQTGLDYMTGTRKPPASWRATAALRRKQQAKPSLGEKTAWNARQYRGKTENPPNSNRVPELQALAKELGLAGWYQNMGWPWCAFFGFLMALKSGSKAANNGLLRGRFNALYTVAILEAAQASRHGMTVVGASEARAGDLALINFTGGDPRVDHLEVVDGPVSNGVYPTTGGNTSAGLTGSQSNGGGVYARTRYVAETRAFVRLT